MGRSLEVEEPGADPERADDPSSFLLLSWSQIRPAHDLWTKSYQRAAASASSHLGASCIRRSKSHRRHLRQAKSHRCTADHSSFSLLSWSQIPGARTTAPIASASSHLGAGCNSRGLQHLPLPRRWLQFSRRTRRQSRLSRQFSRRSAISPPAALARYAAHLKPDHLRYAVNSAKLVALETGHVLGGACAVCCKLGMRLGA